MQLGKFEQADSLLEDAVATAELAGEATLAANAWLVRQFVLLLPGETDAWTAEATQAADGRSRSASRRATTPGSRELRACSRGSAARHAAMAMRPRRSSWRSSMPGEPATFARSAAHRPQFALVAVYGPTPSSEGIVRCAEVAARVVGDRQAEAAVFAVLGQFEAMRGDYERARELCRDAPRDLRGARPALDAATVSLDSSRVELLAGDAEAAERELRRGYDYLSRIGERYLLSSVAGLLAEAMVAQGRLEEAEALSLEVEGSRPRMTSTHRRSGGLHVRRCWRAEASSNRPRRLRAMRCGCSSRPTMSSTRSMASPASPRFCCWPGTKPNRSLLARARALALPKVVPSCSSAWASSRSTGPALAGYCRSGLAVAKIPVSRPWPSAVRSLLPLS